MRKATLIALAFVSTLSGAAAVAVPANAETLDTFTCSTSVLNTNSGIDRQLIKMQLKQKGVNATGVSTWNNCYRVDVSNADGTTSVQYFDPNSLEKVSS